MTEEALEESELRYRRLVEASPAPINIFDASGQIVWGNDAVVELLGLDDREDLVGRSIFEFIHGTDRFTAEQELLAVVEEKSSTGPTLMELERPDGTLKRIRVSTAPGRFDGVDVGQAVVVDVTPITELRERLVLERDFFESALDALEDVFYVVDPDGTLVRWNQALLDVSGYDESEIPEMAVDEFFVDGDAERVAESVATAFADEEAVLEATVVTNSGRTIPFEFRKRRLSRDGETVGVVGIGRDVSDRNARDQHLRAVDRLLQHNLRNKLNVVFGSVDELRDAFDDGGAGGERDGVGSDSSPTASVDRIEEAAEQLLSIFDHHQHIVDVLTGRESTTRIDLSLLVDRVVASRRAAHLDAVITGDVPPDVSVTAVPELERALGELVDNAVVHSDRPSPAVVISADVANGAVRLRVADDGPPIPEMERRVVLGEEPIRRTYHSEGLGLWFVHWVVQRSDGTLSFARNEPRGNVVTVEVPLASTEWTDPGGSTE